jgi:transcriptional regulator with XRE-family HTH domain
MGQTAFKRWRTELGYTQAEAAGALGVSHSQVANWDAGMDRASGNPAVPPKAIRILMQLEAEGQKVEPWPEK